MTSISLSGISTWATERTASEIASSSNSWSHHNWPDLGCVHQIEWSSLSDSQVSRAFKLLSRRTKLWPRNARPDVRSRLPIEVLLHYSSHKQEPESSKLWLPLVFDRLILTAGIGEKLPVIYHECRYRARLRPELIANGAFPHRSLTILIKFQVTLVMDRRYSLS